MAIVIRGRSVCQICGRVMGVDDDLVGFPLFTSNLKDPLILFNDAAFHKTCFEEHPLAQAVTSRVAESEARTGPGHRTCAVCREEIQDERDYLGLGHLAAGGDSPLRRYNYTHLHRSHVRNWTELQEVIRLLEALSSSGTWGGDALTQLIADLRSSGSTEGASAS